MYSKVLIILAAVGIIVQVKKPTTTSWVFSFGIANCSETLLNGGLTREKDRRKILRGEQVSVQV